MATTDGITVVFRVEKYGSLAACKTASRGMQVAFSSIRVKARRLAQRMAGESPAELYPKAKGEFDNIACVVRPLPKDAGYSVAFVPGYAFDTDLEVIDNSTGQPFAGEDPATNRFVMLMGKSFKEEAEAKRHGRKYVSPFSLEELQFMWAHDPEECARMHVAPLPNTPERSAEDYASVDLADLSEDELEIVNPGE